MNVHERLRPAMKTQIVVQAVLAVGAALLGLYIGAAVSSALIVLAVAYLLLATDG